MILRKPYAFLIKQFRIIHIILVFLSVYILNQTSDIYTFFANYISNGYSAVITEDFTTSFINIQLFFILFLLIGGLLTVGILLSYKKKKEKMYFTALIYYIALTIFFIFYYNVFKYMETDLLTANSARIYNDVALIFYLPQYLLVVFFSVRALGFNVKKFNFKDDLKQMDLAEEDNEEIELNIEFDSYKTKKSLRRFIREMRYYIRENLIFFIIISSVLIFTFSYNLISNLSFFNNYNYEMNEGFYYDGFYVTIQNATISNTDIGGEEISTGKYILALTIFIENNTTTDLTFDINDFKLLYNNELITPSNQYANLFSDYGSTVLYSSVKYSSSSTYVLTYQIDEEDINDKFSIKLYSGTYVSGDVTYPIYSIVDLDTTVLKFISASSEYSLSQKLDFTSTNIGSSYINISNYEIANLFYYEYEKCVNEVCSNYIESIYIDYTTSSNLGKTILAIEADLYLDDSTLYYSNNKSYYDFFNNFTTISYVIDGVTYVSEVTAYSKNTNDGKYYLLVPNLISEAEEINLIYTIRNKEFSYALK